MDRIVLVVDTHLEDTGKLTQQPRERLLADEAGACRIHGAPSFLEATDFVTVHDCQAACSLVHVREALVDERHKHIDEDVHADDVPRNEQDPGPRCAPAIAVIEGAAFYTERRLNLCEVLHNLVPAFAATHPEEEDQGVGHRP